MTDWKEKGNEALKNGELDKAIEYFTNGINEDSGNAILYSNRAATYAQKKEWKESLADAENAIKYNPNWSKAYSRKALALFHLGTYEQAIENYQKAADLEQNPQIKTSTLESLDLVKKTMKAAEANVLGEEQLNRGQTASAITFFNQAIEVEPLNTLYLINRAHAYNLARKYDLGIADADKVIQLAPLWHKGYQRKGDALFGQEKYELAAGAYATGLQIQPENEGLNKSFSRAQQQLFLDKHKAKQEEEKKGNSFFDAPVNFVKNLFNSGSEQNVKKN